MKKFVFDVVRYDADDIISTSGASHPIIAGVTSDAYYMQVVGCFQIQTAGSSYDLSFANIFDAAGVSSHFVPCSSFTSGYYHYSEVSSILQECNDPNHHAN